MIIVPSYLRPRRANFVPLTPLSFLNRTADLYPDRLAIIDGERRFTWKEVRRRCMALAASLVRLGVKPGDVVSVLVPNTAEMFEAQFAVAMAGAVLNTINVRLDAETVAYIFEHAETRVLMVDRQFAPLAQQGRGGHGSRLRGRGFPFRRRGGAAPGRFSGNPRPLQGHHHLGR